MIYIYIYFINTKYSNCNIGTYSMGFLVPLLYFPHLIPVSVICLYLQQPEANHTLATNKFNVECMKTTTSKLRKISKQRLEMHGTPNQNVLTCFLFRYT